MKDSLKCKNIKYICVITWWMSASSMDSSAFSVPANEHTHWYIKRHPWIFIEEWKSWSLPKACSHAPPRPYTLTGKGVYVFLSMLHFGIIYCTFAPQSSVFPGTLGQAPVLMETQHSLSLGELLYSDPSSASTPAIRSHLPPCADLYLLSPFRSWQVHPRSPWKWK